MQFPKKVSQHCKCDKWENNKTNSDWQCNQLWHEHLTAFVSEIDSFNILTKTAIKLWQKFYSAVLVRIHAIKFYHQFNLVSYYASAWQWRANNNTDQDEQTDLVRLAVMMTFVRLQLNWMSVYLVSGNLPLVLFHILVILSDGITEIHVDHRCRIVSEDIDSSVYVHCSYYSSFQLQRRSFWMLGEQSVYTKAPVVWQLQPLWW